MGYSDTLFSGGRRFVVPLITKDQETGAVKLSEVGVVFYLADLKEVSEQTGDRIKYQCEHEVIGRVRLKQVLNPRVFADASTYLRVEVEDVIDVDGEANLAETESVVLDDFRQVMSLLQRGGSRVQKDALQNVNATRGSGFWGLLETWQSYLNQRLQASRLQFEQAVRQTVVKYFQDEQQQLPPQISLEDMPPSVQMDIVKLERRFREEAQPLMKVASSLVQECVQSDSHEERLQLLGGAISEEKRRLEAKEALKAVFADSDDE